MSDWSDTCEALVALLSLNVDGLDTATQHLLAPWDPEEGIVDNKRHLAVWPIGEGSGSAETSSPLTLDSQNETQIYHILIWEAAGSESSRGVLDDQATAEFLDLHNAVRRMFHPFRTLAQAWKMVYRGTRLPERSSQVRWFEMEIAVDRAIEFAAV